MFHIGGAVDRVCHVRNSKLLLNLVLSVVDVFAEIVDLRNMG
jgi:hypothetical protein